MTGYTLTPLCVALGIRTGSKVSLINPPPGFAPNLNPLPDGVEFLVTAQSGLDVILFFPKDATELVDRLPAMARAMAVNGGIWVIYPKDLSTKHKLSQDFVRHVALDIGLVDNKLWPITETLEGLRLVWRPKTRLEKPEHKKKAPVAEA